MEAPREIQQAFLLGAGLGNRLQPLTSRLPKPLVPLFHRPLISWAMRACAQQSINRFAINTHHLPTCWNEEILQSSFPELEKATISWFHEPILLETGGGLKNIRSWIENRPTLVHNGDIFSTIALDRLIQAHHRNGMLATLALRSSGDAKHIAINEDGSQVLDIRNSLGRANGTHVFTGIYCVQPEMLDFIPAEDVVSVIPAFLKLAEKGLLGCITLDDGFWRDLGDFDSYLSAHRELSLDSAIHPRAIIHPLAYVENSVVGPGAVIAEGARINSSVIWENTTIGSNAELDACIVYSNKIIDGAHHRQCL